jgi:hypothetical protein
MVVGNNMTQNMFLEFKEYYFEELYADQGLFANYDNMIHRWIALQSPPFTGHPTYG